MACKTRKQIASEYGVDIRTLRRWLKEQQISFPNRMLTPKDQKLIYRVFGWPPCVDPQDYKLAPVEMPERTFMRKSG